MNINKIIRRRSFIDRIIYKFYVAIKNAELPRPSNIGCNIRFPHGLKGIILHPSTTIEDNVTIFHQVTCGRGDMYNIFPNAPKSRFKGIVLKEGCVLCTGAKIICNSGTLTVGKNTIIAANAVLIESTGDNEIWGGIPAKLIKSHNWSHQTELEGYV